MNVSLSAQFGDGNAGGFRPSFQCCDNSLLVHDADRISINATLQQQLCKSISISEYATDRFMDGLETDGAFVRDFCKWAKAAPSNIAGQAGLAATTLLRPFNGTASTRISQTTLDKLRAKFPNYPGWNRDRSDHLGQMGDRLPPNEPKDDLAYVRAVDISLAMGEGIIGEDYPATELIPFNIGFLRAISDAITDKLLIMTGQGDSMEPTLLRSDRLMIDTSDRTPKVSDKIWAFIYAGGGMIKRLRRVRDDGRDRFLIISDNPAVPPQMADIDDLFIIGKLVWVGRQM